MGNNLVKRDRTHLEQIERWANYVRDNPDWKIKHKMFIDGQIIMARRAYESLLRTSSGRKKIEELRKLRLLK